MNGYDGRCQLSSDGLCLMCAGGGVAAYETSKAVDEYLQFHFGKNEEVLPYPHGPKLSY